MGKYLVPFGIALVAAIVVMAVSARSVTVRNLITGA